MDERTSASGPSLLAAGRFSAAAQVFEEQVRRHPNSAPLWHDLGLARFRSRDTDGARAAFERALQLAPGDVKCQLNLARTELEAGNMSRAQTLCEALPEVPEALVMLGHLHEVSGRADEAAAAFRGAADHEAGFVGAWCGLARLGLIDDPELLGRRVDRGDLSRTDEASLRMALAQAYDRKGQHDRAFAEAARGNALRVTNFDPGAFTRLIDEVLRSPLPAADSGSKATPVFIVGAPRSGSSLLERVLARHPRMVAFGERAEAGRIAHRLTFPQGCAELDAAGLSSLADEYLAGLGPLPEGVTHSIDKAPSNILIVGLLSRIFPRATFLHARRDPRDVAVSNFLTDFGDHRVGQTTSIPNLGRYLPGVQRLADHWCAQPGLRILEVRHEELVDDLEGQVRRVLSMLELPWDPACLTFYEDDQPCRTASSQQVRQPLNRRGIGRWKPYARYLGSLAQGPA